MKNSRRLKAEEKLIARALSELSFEGVLAPAEETPGSFSVTFAAAGVTYQFRARRGAWGHLSVELGSVRRLAGGKSAPARSAAQFFLDAREAHGMADITLAHFFEEMQNTLFGDEILLARQAGKTAAFLAQSSDLKIQSLLDGHPKILLNKGRLGFTAEDFLAYAPEAAPRFRLHWLAVKKEAATLSLAPQLSAAGLRAECLDGEEEARLNAVAASLAGGADAYHYFPVHPWQWNRVVRLQFGGALANGTLEHLGVFGDEYQPQVSLRTLSNVSRPGRADLKLPLTVLNTSAYRGISGKYVPSGPALSHRLATLLEDDAFLAERGTRVRRELGGISVTQPEYAKIEGAPYRYHELLGAIWREAGIDAGERTMLTAALSQSDESGASLARALIRRSGLPAADWLRAYFRVVVIPLYHLQAKHGIGLVAHGQNVVLRLKNDIPTGIYLKDFQGDLRFAEGSFPARDATLASSAAHLPRLPAAHLIHDLITGHLVSVLRFFAAALAADPEPVAEEEFYGLLGAELKAYTEGREIPAALSLLRPEFERVLLNKVRFQIGYADSSERPLPALGAPLLNPISLAMSSGGIQ